jgi:hypothetical protein
MILVTDINGGIIAATLVQANSGNNPQVRMEPLPGQQIHEVEVPEEVAEIGSGHSFFMAISGARIEPGTGKLIMSSSVQRVK